jgi:predicted RNA-binding Zn-ribbon protein involved in translation (DUF1610 family)
MPLENNESINEEMTEESRPPDESQPRFPCSRCGAKLVYKPGTGAQHCPYCGQENTIAKSQETVQELDLREHLARMSHQEELEECLTVTCPECAAEITTAANITSQPCPYCGSNIVASARSAKRLKPKSLLPFRVEEKQAAGLFRQWIAKRWFAPSDLIRLSLRENRCSGMYVPYWTYDSRTTSSYQGQRGTHYWVTESYTTRVNGRTVHHTRPVRKTRWNPVSGTVRHAFDDVLVLASASLPRKYTEKLEPWDLKNLIPYSNEYLTGFRAESYQIDLATGFAQATAIMDDYIRVLVRQDIGGDEQRIDSVNTRFEDLTFKHVLLTRTRI